MKWWFKRLGIGTGLALLGVVALAAGAVSLAVRQSSEAATDRAASTDRSGWDGVRHRGFSPEEMRKRRDRFHSDLAKELGVSKEKVDKAFRTLFERRLNRAVERGRLTRKQANRILECYDKGTCKPPFRHRRGFRGPPGGGPPMGGPGAGGPPPGGPDFGPPM